MQSANHDLVARLLSLTHLCSSQPVQLPPDRAARPPRSTYAIIWGAVLTGVFTLIPTFKHLRIICILGLVGTSYTAVYIWAESGKSGLKDNWATGPTSLEVPLHTCRSRDVLWSYLVPILDVLCHLAWRAPASASCLYVVTLNISLTLSFYWLAELLPRSERLPVSLRRAWHVIVRLQNHTIPVFPPLQWLRSSPAVQCIA